MVTFKTSGSGSRAAACATFFALLCHVGAAHALFLTATGGTRSSFKGIATGTDLVCNLAGMTIDATTQPLAITLGGADGSTIACKEVSNATGLPVPGKEGLFKFTQTTPLDGSNCLSATSAAGVTTWTCKVSRGTIARWNIAPLPEYQALFCSTPIDPATCYAEHGTPLRAKAQDFPDRDVDDDGLTDFGGVAGVVFTFDSNGKLLFGPCHSGTFDGGSPVLCTQKVAGTTYKTQTKGSSVSDLVFAVDTASGSLNLNNGSDSISSNYTTYFYGAADVDVAKIAERINEITLRGPACVAPSCVPEALRNKGFSIADLQGPDGTVDAYPDLVVNFDRAQLIAEILKVTGVCPIERLTVRLQLRGPYGATGGGAWTGFVPVDLFNCPVQ